MEAFAEIIRGLVPVEAVQQLPDAALVGGAAGAGLLVLIILFSLIGAIAGGGKKKRAEQEEPAPRRAEREAPREAPPRQRAAEPVRQGARAPDPIQTMERNAAANAGRVRREADELQAMLAAERARVAAAGADFALVVPTRGLRLLAESLVDARDPARAAARRKLAAGDFDGARADLRRQAEASGAGGAWRDFAVLEAFKDVVTATDAFEHARKSDPNDFVTLVTLRRLYAGRNRPGDARDVAQAAVAAAGDDRERAIALDELGESCMLLRDPNGAQAAYGESLRIVRAAAERAPNDPNALRDLAIGHFKLATVRAPDSVDHLAKAVATFEKLQASGPLDADDAKALEQMRAVLADEAKKKS